MNRSDSRAELEAWGSWADAERWRAEEFAARSPAARLAWLEDLWRLSALARTTASDATPMMEARSVAVWAPD
jgi:hypothetical protein